MRILLLEDDVPYRDSIKEYLEDIGFLVDGIGDGNEAYEMLYEHKYDLGLFDVRVMGCSGYDLLKKIRLEGNHTPVIFITSLTDINNLTLGYELGCNDYIRKPFSLRELKYRVHETIKRKNFDTTAEEVELKYGYSFCIKSETLKKDGVTIELTQKERLLVSVLVKNLDRFMSTEELRSSVWDYKDVLDSDIRMMIKKVRDKSNKEFIVSIRSIGYKIEKRPQ